MVEQTLQVESLRVETVSGAEIVDEVSFSVAQGEVFAVVGESGCGKTSVALALLAHARPGTRIGGGSVRVGDDDLLSLPAAQLRKLRGSRISYVPQDPTSGLNPRRRVGWQVEEALRIHEATRAEAAVKTSDALQGVGLPSDREFLRRYPFELSGGQQQRVTIAIALIARPLIVVLDEPTTGLDVTTQAQILELLLLLGRETGTSFVYVTHDLAVVDNLADRVAVMYAGRLVETGPRERVMRNPAHPYTSLLLESIPRLSVRQRLVGIGGAAPSPGARPPGCAFAPRCPISDDACAEAPPEKPIEESHTVRCWQAGELFQTPAGLPTVAADSSARPDGVVSAFEIVASYGRDAGRPTILHGISLSVAEGECVAVVGESGSGKTTLARCLAGFHVPDSGSVQLRGRPLAPSVVDRSLDDCRAIQYIFQNPDRSLNPRHTVRRTIERSLRAFAPDGGRQASRQEVERLLEQVQLSPSYAERFPRELSGGEKQRVAIARALAARPALLVCDEVTSALDVSIQASIVALLDDARKDGLGLLFITHNLALVNSIADHVLVLEQGHLREAGTTTSVIQDPQHAYTQQLLAAAPELAATERGQSR